MGILIVGLVLFLGIHTVSIVAPQWRAAQVARLGERPWKGLYSLASAIGLGLLIYGYGAARHDPVVLYAPPNALRHLALLLMVPVFPLLVAAYFPGRIQAAAKHPMLLATKLWATAHLLANGTLADVLLFGGFLAWAVFDFRAARRRDRAAGTVYPPGTPAGTAAAIGVGVAAWAVFALWGHAALIGVRPFG